MHAFLRALRISLPLLAGLTLLTGLFLFSAVYRFELKSIPVPSNNNPSMAVDSNGALHFSHCVSYELYNNDQGLYYTSNYNGEWETARIVNNASVDSTSIAVDALGRLHIAYTYDLDLETGMPPGMVEGIVGYATNSSGEWRTYVVSHGFGLYRQCSLDVGSTGDPGILFVVSGELMFASFAPGTEDDFVVESLGATAFSGDIAFDAADVPHASYANNGSLYLATRLSPGDWSSINVFVGGVSDAQTSLAYGNGTSPRIAFFADCGGKGLFYGDSLSGSWNITKVSNVTETKPAFCSLFVAGDGTPHISSSSGTDLAMYSELYGDRWINSHLVGGDAGPTEIGISPSGHVYIALDSGGRSIDYLEDDASHVDIMSQVPYLFSLAVALIIISGIFVLVEVVRIIRRDVSKRKGSKRRYWPPQGI